MDKDRGGTLNTEEIKNLMDLLGMKVKAEDLEAMVMAKPANLPYNREDVMRAFRMFAEKDAPAGCISPEALERALVNSLEVSQEGYIDYHKKCNLFLNK
ncbi:hypothetical protein GPECTOR_41g695 [Gonium pectorale]|uniref:EF-hand domain-containing protein n=1 Tax=Gonium pectorale TaxID=33097 RepID=A0A150GBJ1_GONPE|nr:hypothetical protein GPECTOR_41g695 [Gonium pectorale]|eukprot:KXZ46730.1 hypothetical protein GPECTOR_41g695 [Gonium pectorale]